MKIVLAFLLVCLTGCGYQFGSSQFSSRYSTLSVPYVSGDFDGSFTNEMIHHISTGSVFQYRRVGADLVLKIDLVDFDVENIGYRYYRNKNNKLTRETIPVETRSTVTAVFSLIDACTGYEVLSPVEVSATTDFDHDYYSTRDQINSNSLGQLTDYDEALDASKKPLFFNLAKKISDYINDSW